MFALRRFNAKEEQAGWAWPFPLPFLGVVAVDEVFLLKQTTGASGAGTCVVGVQDSRGRRSGSFACRGECGGPTWLVSVSRGYGKVPELVHVIEGAGCTVIVE